MNDDIAKVVSSSERAVLNKYQTEDEIDFRELLIVLWKNRWLIIGVTFLSSLIAIAISLMLTNIYRAELVLAPAETQTSASPLAGQLGGAAALIGIDVGNIANDNRVTNAMAVMQSRQFVSKFIRDYSVLIPLFAGKWDGANGISYIDSGVYDEASSTWVKQGNPPSDAEAYRVFTKALTVSQDRITSLVSVAFDWHDPILAEKWSNALVYEINKQIKDNDRSEANNAISYLRKQLQSTQLVEMQRVFYNLIESQTRVTMLADSREEYVFQIIDPAVVPDKKIAPRRLLIVLAGTLFGGLIALTLVFMRHTFSKSKL